MLERSIWRIRRISAFSISDRQINEQEKTEATEDDSFSVVSVSSCFIFKPNAFANASGMLPVPRDFDTLSTIAFCWAGRKTQAYSKRIHSSITRLTFFQPLSLRSFSEGT